MHLHFDLDDPRWAIVLAGALQVARTGDYRAVNPKFTVSFERGKNPLIDYIANAFEIKPADAPTYNLPKPEQYPFIDYYQASTHAKNLFEQHGIKQDPVPIPLYLQSLAANSILLTHGIASKPGYYVPVPGRTALDSAPNSDVIIESREMESIALAFCEGLGIEDPVVISCEDYDDKTIAIASYKTKAIVSRPHHYTQYVARSCYTGFDGLALNVPVVAVIDSTSSHDNRFLVSWNAQLPIAYNEYPENIINRGKAWKIRQEFGFDHRKYYKSLNENK
jgi:hypothetical protein